MAMCSQVLTVPLTTEAALNRMKQDNSLTLVVARTADKKQIKVAVEETFRVPVDRVNTATRPHGLKLAFVKLPLGHNALDMARKNGVI